VAAGILPASERGFQPRDPFAVVQVLKCVVCNGKEFSVCEWGIHWLVLPADKAHILRSIAGHIVAGTATDIERKQLDSLLAALEK